MSNLVEDLPIAGQKFGLGLSWDEAGGHSIDVDIQAVAFNMEGRLIDAVYYNNMKAFRGGMTHSGDEHVGDKKGLDECIWVNFARIPADLKIVAFVVACYTGGHLRDVPNGKFHLLENSLNNEVAQFRLEESEEEVDLVGALIRDDTNNWVFRMVDEDAADGQHFIDILEPVIGNFVRQVIPSAPRRIKACFAMDKGSIVDMPKSRDIRQVKIGLGWDTGSGSVDLDVSAVMLRTGEEVKEHNTVFFGNLSAPGIQHAGDNLTGEGDGDDETITIDLEAVESEVSQVVFIVNIYSRGKTFSEVANPYCRVLTEDREELCRYSLSEAGTTSALIISRLLRAPDGLRWSFQALGQPCEGKTYKDSLPYILQVGQKKASAFQVRSLSSASILEPPPGVGLEQPPGVSAAAPSTALAQPPEPAKPKSSACSLQ